MSDICDVGWDEQEVVAYVILNSRFDERCLDIVVAVCELQSSHEGIAHHGVVDGFMLASLFHIVRNFLTAFEALYGLSERGRSVWVSK
jgi:hypothetical protein